PLLVSRREHHSLERSLDAPAVCYELARQIIEQFWMRRPLAEDAEVVNAGDKSATEKVVPEAVDEDARSERIRGVGDFLGEFQAAAVLCRIILLRSGNGLQETV